MGNSNNDKRLMSNRDIAFIIIDYDAKLRLKNGKTHVISSLF